MNIDIAAFRQTFFDETEDILAEFESTLLQLEVTPEDSLGLLNTIFRCAHSIKGGSATFGFTDVAHFTHSLETLLDLLRNGQLEVDQAMIQLLLASLDQLKALLSAARGDELAAPDSEALIVQIEEIIAQTGHQEEVWDEDALRIEIAKMVAEQEQASSKGIESLVAIAESGAYMYHLRFAPGADVLRRGIDPAALLARLAQASSEVTANCDLSRLPSLQALEPETCYLSWDVEFRSDWEQARLLALFEDVRDICEVTLEVTTGPEAHPTNVETGVEARAMAVVPELAVGCRVSGVGQASPSPPRLGAGGRVSTLGEAQTLRISASKVDQLINLVGELVIGQSALTEAIQDFSMAKLPRLREAVAEMGRAGRELQERVMAVRMLPIKMAFGRFPRLVHDLSMACGKQIELRTTGEETELDKTVIDGIVDPLTHLVRNCVDHGMETPEDRLAVGKDGTGLIFLNAFHEGGSIVIEVSDDGRGLNRERILQKAIEGGLLHESEPIPADDVLFDLIFRAGFSTAPSVTDVSGRGVGMDIVRQAVQRLGGTIMLNSMAGKGTRFRVRLPLTMAILDGLSVSVGEEVYILPLTSIVESIRPRHEDVRRIAGRAEVFVMRGESLPVLRLYQLFGVEPRSTEAAGGLMVIVENDGTKVALFVDALIGQNQAVIKSLETNYRTVEGIAGATIMGDGGVALILDVPGLITMARDRPLSRVA